ncbi:MAG: CBS domain-containing protein [Xanthomonadales bacterium]|nr:CBS domain-containing protein [Xanthomonadales bacterium]
MSEDSPSSNGSGGRSWLDRIASVLSGELRNREELIDELRNAHSNGLLDADTLAMLEGAITVSDKRVEDVMVPRPKIAFVPVEATVDELMQIVVESGHSRFPVQGDDPDEILGMLHAKDLLRHFARGGELQLRSLLRPLNLIPESKRLNELLKDFRVNRQHLALVVDEYGGVAGLVTIEDVLEEIVGEIDDEHDAEDKPEVLVNDRGDGIYQVQGMAPIEAFNAHFGCEFSDEEFDTIGGMVTQAFGHLPESGERIELEGFQFEVAKADQRRLLMLHVRPPEGVTAAEA